MQVKFEIFEPSGFIFRSKNVRKFGRQ